MHTFHMPHGDMAIIIQDVTIILGLPVDGPPLASLTLQQRPKICESLLGHILEEYDLDGSRLNMTWLAMKFPILPFDVDDVV